MSREVRMLLDGSRQDSDEDQAIGLHCDERGPRRDGLLAADHDMHARAKIDRLLKILQAGVREPFIVGAVVIDHRSQVIASP